MAYGRFLPTKLFGTKRRPRIVKVSIVFVKGKVRQRPEAKSEVLDWRIKSTRHRVGHGKCAGVDSGVVIR